MRIYIYISAAIAAIYIVKVCGATRSDRPNNKGTSETREYVIQPSEQGGVARAKAGVATNAINVSSVRVLAEKGNAQAQNTFGECFRDGIGITVNKGEAVRWFRKAAEQGDAKAQYNLGLCLFKGEGVMKYRADAIKWFRKAAEHGYAQAQNILGECCRDGDGITRSDADAIKWFRLAAEQSNFAAQRSLGECYYMGRGVGKDYIEAWKWKLLADATESNLADGVVPNVKLVSVTYADKNITRVQFDEAKDRAIKWQQEHQKPRPDVN